MGCKASYDAAHNLGAQQRLLVELSPSIHVFQQEFFFQGITSYSWLLSAMAVNNQSGSSSCLYIIPYNKKPCKVVTHWYNTPQYYYGGHQYLLRSQLEKFPLLLCEFRCCCRVGAATLTLSYNYLTGGSKIAASRAAFNMLYQFEAAVEKAGKYKEGIKKTTWCYPLYCSRHLYWSIHWSSFLASWLICR